MRKTQKNDQDLRTIMYNFKSLDLIN